MATPLRKVREYLGGLGAGLVAGASDNDPTTVATLAVIGSATLYGLSWLVVLILPMLLIVQVISARLGVVSHRSLQEIIHIRFGHIWALVSMVFVASVDIITIAADLEGGGAAIGLMTGLDWRIFVPFLAGIAAALLLLGRYRNVQRILRYVLLVFVAYIGAGILARPNWGEVLRHTVIPTFQFTPDYVTGALALLGSALTSYVYFWETIEEEEEKTPKEKLGLAQFDAAIGIILTCIIFWFILVSSATASSATHIRVQTAQDAAAALQPLAGPLAEELFGIGLLASAVLALPILAATTGYVVTQSAHRGGSIGEPVNRKNLLFYGVIVASLVVGAALSVLGIEPVRLLYFASIAGGLGTPVLMALLFIAAGDEKVMGKDRVRGLPRIGGWITAGVVSLSGLLYLVYQWFNSGR